MIRRLVGGPGVDSSVETVTDSLSGLQKNMVLIKGEPINHTNQRLGGSQALAGDDMIQI